MVGLIVAISHLYPVSSIATQHAIGMQIAYAYMEIAYA